MQNVYRKSVKLHAKRATEDGVIETILNGVLETRVPYSKGDWIMLGTEGERYPMSHSKFLARYDPESATDEETPSRPGTASSRPGTASSRPGTRSGTEAARRRLDRAKAEGFRLYQAKGQVWAHRLTELEHADHFPLGQLKAPWGEAMLISPGDYLAIPYPSGGELYRIQPKVFAETYKREPGNDRISISPALVSKTDSPRRKASLATPRRKASQAKA